MESDEEDTPETIIPASSPESNLGDVNPRFPHLLEPKEEETERAISPIIPLIPRTAIPGTQRRFQREFSHKDWQNLFPKCFQALQGFDVKAFHFTIACFVK